MRQAERLEARHTRAETLDQPPGDRVCRSNGDLLPDDRADADLERAPGPGSPQPRPLHDQRADDLVLGKDADRLVELEVEVRDVPRTLHDVHELFPVRQMGRQQQMVVAARAQLEDAGCIADDDRPAIRVT